VNKGGLLTCRFCGAMLPSFGVLKLPPFHGYWITCGIKMRITMKFRNMSLQRGRFSTSLRVPPTSLKCSPTFIMSSSTSSKNSSGK